MCCDICPKYDECDEKNRLTDECCPRCPEYSYCKGEDKSDTGDADSDDGGKVGF